MSKTIFTVAVVACLAGLGAIAMESRPTANASSAKTAAPGPSVETTVIQRTERVTRHKRSKSDSSSGSSSSGSSSSSGQGAVAASNASSGPGNATAVRGSDDHGSDDGPENEVEHGDEAESEHGAENESDDSGRDSESDDD